MVRLQKDLREFVELLNFHRVDYMLVGGYALAAHGLPRNTGDVDFWVRIAPDNAAKLTQALEDFGFGSLGITREDFMEAGIIIQLGRPPNRIDLLTAIDGVNFDAAWEDRIEVSFDGVPILVISRETLIMNKRAAARPQDLADVARLEGIGTSDTSSW